MTKQAINTMDKEELRVEGLKLLDYLAENNLEPDKAIELLSVMVGFLKESETVKEMKNAETHFPLH